MQKNSHAAVYWFPISAAECIGLMLNPKTNTNKAGASGLVSEKYDDQICSAANMENQSAAAAITLAVKNRIANEIRIHFYVTDTDDCKTDLRFSRHF